MEDESLFSAFWKRKYVILWYLGSVYLTLAYFAYAMSWKEFGETPDNTRYWQNQIVSGVITSLKGSGFGSDRSYVIRVGQSGDILLPAFILAPQAANDQFPTVNAGSYLDEGKEVRIKTSGGRPVVLQLFVKEKDGTERELVSDAMGQSRYVAGIQSAKKLSEEYSQKAYLAFPFALLCHVLFILARSVFRKKKRAPIKAT